jgi:HrpA-like RNA helicase
VINYVVATVDTVLRLHTTQKSGNILVFLPGEFEIKEAYKLLPERIE